MTPTAALQETRLGRLRARMAAHDLDAFVITHLPNLQYATGFSGSAGAAVVLPRSCLLVVDFRYVTAAKALEASLGGAITVEKFERSYDEALIGVLRRERPMRIGIEAAYLPVSRFNAISAGIAQRTSFLVASDDWAPVLAPTERIIEAGRIIKDADEVRTLRDAGRRLAAVAAQLHAMVHVGRTERSIADAIEVALRAAGFSRPSFDTIVASGPNSALPHARPTDRILQAGDPTVLDFGGVLNGYCVDLTRTVQLGPASPALARLYAAVAEAQAAAINAVRPGVASSSIDASARSVLERYGLGDAFGHGTGHGLGLEVHEEPRIARHSDRLPDHAIEPGMVFTIEPGAYVPGVGGVRIEDDVLVTETGCEVLTR